ncbi:hypothetical protein EK21DRAFT_94978 [Setomelanomma holmii]|uniref:Apple domain-containing protein n=1 Tax=Setomelanomma holmii TaxID=210430 RepID=A0A9P4GVA5_9PLEO|nr:hypothetical protein EK21DRAFT_94978 [Setomelanomma holmii]
MHLRYCSWAKEPIGRLQSRQSEICLDERNAKSDCKDVDVAIVNNVLSQYSKSAWSICSKILRIPAPTTLRQTSVIDRTVQVTSFLYSTVTSAAISVAPVPVSTVVVPQQVSCTQKQKKVGYPSCAYNRYYRAVNGVSGDPGANNDFAVGLQQCEAACTSDHRCKFFYYDAYDPDQARGYSGGECDLMTNRTTGTEPVPRFSISGETQLKALAYINQAVQTSVK